MKETQEELEETKEEKFKKKIFNFKKITYPDIRQNYWPDTGHLSIRYSSKTDPCKSTFLCIQYCQKYSFGKIIFLSLILIVTRRLNQVRNGRNFVY